MSKDMVEQFLCPGCVVGINTKCGKYRPQFPSSPEGSGCGSHVLGTSILGVGNIALGLPKGFNRAGITWDGYGEPQIQNKMEVRLWSFERITSGDAPQWDRFNVPVWSIVVDGYLFVRTYSPRTNRTFVDVVEGGTLDMLGVMATFDVSAFIDEID